MVDDIEHYFGEENLPAARPRPPCPDRIPILVLDVDGVLNTRPGSLDQDKLAELERICWMTHCRIVLSSSWRTVLPQLLRLNRVLRDRGITLCGMTPDLTYQVGKTLLAARHRWEEIQHWLDAHGSQYGRVVILDDQTDMGPLQARLVSTDSHVGLTDSIADHIINLFNE